VLGDQRVDVGERFGPEPTRLFPAALQAVEPDFAAPPAAAALEKLGAQSTPIDRQVEDDPVEVEDQQVRRGRRHLVEAVDEITAHGRPAEPSAPVTSTRTTSTSGVVRMTGATERSLRFGACRGAPPAPGRGGLVVPAWTRPNNAVLSEDAARLDNDASRLSLSETPLAPRLGPVPSRYYGRVSRARYTSPAANNQARFAAAGVTQIRLMRASIRRRSSGTRLALGSRAPAPAGAAMRIGDEALQGVSV